MARKTFVELVDDTSGGKADETVTFGLDGVSYEIDLSTENAAKLREAVSPWAGAGRRVGGRRNAKRARSGPDAGKVRAWAIENGYDVGDRGRIPTEIQDAYTAAH